MDFLTLCQRTARECKIPGAGPSTVASQTGELGDIVRWVALAWDEIQEYRRTWKWMRGTFSFNTVAATSVYSLATIGIDTTFRVFQTDATKIYLTATGLSDEGLLPYLPWALFEYRYLIGSVPNDRPQAWTNRPEDNAVVVGPTADAVYTISGTYWKAQTKLVNNADEPDMPADFHPLIVYWAAENYAAGEEAEYLRSWFERKKSEWLARLEETWLQKMNFAAQPLGGPMTIPDAAEDLRTGFTID